MKRAIILIALAALPLAACSSKAKSSDGKAAASADGKEPHVNPWAKDPPPGSVPTDAASDKPKPAKKQPQPAMD